MLVDIKIIFYVAKIFLILFLILLCREFNGKIQETKDEAANSAEAYSTAKKLYLQEKETHSAKVKEWRTSQTFVKRLESDISLLRKEIERLET